MIGLIAKELRQLLPIAYLWLAVLVLGYGMQFLTERVDEKTFGSWCEGYCEYSSNPAVVCACVWFASCIIICHVVRVWCFEPIFVDDICLYTLFSTHPSFIYTVFAVVG